VPDNPPVIHIAAQQFNISVADPGHPDAYQRLIVPDGRQREVIGIEQVVFEYETFDRSLLGV
jgi:hypothetical protein